MRPLRTLLLTLITALFAVSGMARAMPMPAAQPPCHEAPADHGKSTPAQAAMTCCIGCMPAPAETAVILTSVAAKPTVFGVAVTEPEGRMTAPEPHPPRLRA